MRSLKAILLFTLCTSFFSCGTRHPDTCIRLENEGCFGANTSELLFYNESDSILVTLLEDGKETQRTLIGEGQIAAISYFQQKIEALRNDGYSTTAQHFTLESGPVKIKKTYYGYCDDFDRLKAVLFMAKK